MTYSQGFITQNKKFFIASGRKKTKYERSKRDKNIVNHALTKRYKHPCSTVWHYHWHKISLSLFSPFVFIGNIATRETFLMLAELNHKFCRYQVDQGPGPDSCPCPNDQGEDLNPGLASAPGQEMGRWPCNCDYVREGVQYKILMKCDLSASSYVTDHGLWPSLVKWNLPNLLSAPVPSIMSHLNRCNSYSHIEIYPQYMSSASRI